MKLFTKPIHYIELVIAVIFCYTLAIDHQIMCDGPDCKLYRRLSVNLFSEIGYVDNSRNDYILPPVGHPALLGAMHMIDFDDEIDIITYFCFISLVLCYLFCCFLKLSPYLKIIAVLFLNYSLPPLYESAIEPSLVLSILLLWIGVYTFLTLKTKSTAIFLGLVLLFNLFVRPILAPLFYLTLAIVLVAYVLNRKRFKKEAIALTVCGILFFGVAMYSTFRYDDSRMITGTYSEITLYCAYNPYIPLEKEYRSYHWNALPDSIYKEAVLPFQLKTTWQDRATLLRERTIDFISENPVESWKGYTWRLKKYTVDQEVGYGTQLFYIWLFFIPFFLWKIKEFPVFKLIVVGLPAYVILILSVFPYAQLRYLLTPNLYMLCSLLFMVSYLDRKNLLTVNSLNQ